MGCAASKPSPGDAGSNGDGDGRPLPASADSNDSPFKERARRQGYSSGNAQLGEAPAASTLKISTAPKTEKELKCLKEACSGVVLFSAMTSKQQAEIFEHMYSVVCETGDRVITQGEIGDVLYVVESGQFDAYVRAQGDKSVCTYNSGGLFGELGVMYHCPRAATVSCTQAGRLWGLSRTVFEKVVRSTIEVRMDSKSQFLRSVELLSQLSEAEREALADVLVEVSYKSGDCLWEIGDPADCLILIKHGNVDVREGSNDSFTKSGQTSNRLKDGAQLHAGDFFGTQAMTELNGEVPKRRVQGVCVGQVDVYQLHRSAARELGDLPELIVNNSRVKAMRNLEWFLSLKPRERIRACHHKPTTRFAADTLILQKEHIAGQGMYVITEGSVTASVDGNGGASETLQAGATFMSESLAGGGSVAAEATYRSRGCVCVVVDRAMLRDICEYGRERRASSQSELEQRLIKLDDLNVVATLGVGGFGRVKLVRHIKSDSHFALKCMYKGLVIAKRQTEHILNERNLLGMCQHSFLPTLVTTFQDRTQIFVLMELILGGELFSLVATRGRLKEREAAFYVANVTCALEYLHARNIAYRDLKPENLMLDDMGYLKVVDFGFAKVVEDRTFTVCGTPDYLAPETIRRAGHTTTVDWWAMGVLLYELITGQSPFHGGTQMDVLTRIVCGRVPRNNLLSSSAWLMISELLEVDPIRRLGSRVRGRRAVREHTFFAAHVDVDALERKELKAPWVPTIESPSDMRNFDSYGDEVESDPAEWDRYLKIAPDAFENW